MVFLTPPGNDYVIAQWAIWRAGGIAVPLCTTHPPPELEYVIDDAQAHLAIVHPTFAATLEPIAQRRGVRVWSTEALAAAPSPTAVLPRVDAERGAMLLYTSGTTGKPKGVLSTHAMLAAQIQSIVKRWEWTERDHILHVLPLHHLHGILNVLCCALWSGACCEFLPRFDPERVWQRIGDGADLTLFMAVPTIYAKLSQRSNRRRPRAARSSAKVAGGCA